VSNQAPLNVKPSGLTPEAKGTIAALWKLRHNDTLARKMLKAAIHSEQKWRNMFRKLPGRA